MGSVVGEISSPIIRGLGANSGGGAALGVGVMGLKMTFRVRTTHLPSDEVPGAPPLPRCLLPYSNYQVRLGLGIPAFGQGSGEMRVPITQLAISLRKEVA